MSHAVKLTNEVVNLQADAIMALLDGGFLDIMDGAKPAGPAIAITTQVLLAVLALANPSQASGAVAGVATFDTIAPDTDANATGTATWARLYKADHTTAVMDIEIGTSLSDLNLPTVSIVQHATVSITSLTYTASKG